MGTQGGTSATVWRKRAIKPKQTPGLPPPHDAPLQLTALHSKQDVSLSRWGVVGREGFLRGSVQSWLKNPFQNGTRIQQVKSGSATSR